MYSPNIGPRIGVAAAVLFGVADSDSGIIFEGPVHVPIESTKLKQQAFRNPRI